ncbi:MAG TPA: phosphate ABC transporter permease subunit PstC [Acidimicrobiales bacterium]|nr:phosphate ABC transporter permease subunit PstC [Acidimicrobiales bacterium]
MTRTAQEDAPAAGGALTRPAAGSRSFPGPRRRVVLAARAYPVAGALAAVVFLAVVAALVASIGTQSAQAWAHDGIGFLWSERWDPASGRLGAGLLVVGTLVTTGCAVVLAVPVGVGAAVYLSEMAPRRVAAVVGAGIELLASIPSIVVGLWALLVLSPLFARDVEPFLKQLPGLGALFGGPAYGPGILLAAVVLAIMILPTVVALTSNSLAGVGRADREAALALGATRWQVVRRAVLPAARSGIAAAITLAVGRALGESIAVAMVIGNRPSIPHSLLAPGATIGSAIVNQFAEAQPGLETSSIIALAAVLLLLTVAVNAGGVALLRRTNRTPAFPVPGPPVDHPPTPTTATDDTAGTAGGAVTHAIGAHPSRSLRRRRATSRVMTITCALATVLGLVPLGALVYFTVARGIHDLSVGFLSHAPAPAGVPGGGISTAITGSARIIGLALLLALPVGLLGALFLYERRGIVASAVRFSADVLTGVPSIVVGIFAYAVLVVPFHHPSTTAAAFALAVLMVPIMIRGNEEAFRAVPVDLREAGTALGGTGAGVARRVVVREALAPVISANLLAAARGIGETAPLLFTVAAPTAAMTLLIFDQGTQAFPSAQQTAWATALVLLLTVAALSALARVAAWYLTRHQH